MKYFFVFICALFMSMSAHAVTFNFQHNGTTKQILMDTTQRTHPAFAAQIGNTVYYANMEQTTEQIPGNVYISYNGNTYEVRDNSKYKFLVTTTPDTTSFSFKLSAKGTFTVDWGDGVVDEIVRINTNDQTYSHTYDAPGEYSITFDGHATGYSTYPVSWMETDPGTAISFMGNNALASIDGSLGAIFPTIDGTEYGAQNGGQPRFKHTFSGCTKLGGTIPENLFDGVYGMPPDYMFDRVFYNCAKLSGSIPEKLFAGIDKPSDQLFGGTFYGCSGLSGPIPEKLFAGITGTVKTSMFHDTFQDCSGLTGPIPENLFAGLTGMAGNIFANTFRGCSGLTGKIPEKLFAGIKGAPTTDLFAYTFYGCSGLTGNIPAKLFAGISGSPAYSMYRETFKNCSGLSGEIPVGLFGNISGAPADYMFYYTFYGCSGLTGPTARMSDGTRLYDVMYNGRTWYEQRPYTFSNMYTGTGIDIND